MRYMHKSRRSGRAKAKFPTAAGGTAVRVTPGAGGHNLGTPTHCASKRAHANVKSY